MMNEIKIRGFVDDDDIAFGLSAIPKLSTAQEELHFLLNRGYPMKSALTFVGNHHQLTVRQSLALVRATASTENLAQRKVKQLKEIQAHTVHIDGFNLIITLEVALSDGMLFVGQDGCIRDLAELRGTYRLIPQTEKAIALIRDALSNLKVSGAVFYLDQPVSNSGRLKAKIYEIDWPMPVTVDIVRSPDAVLKQLPCVVTSDSIILDACERWFNLTSYVLAHSGLSHKLTRLIDLDEV